MTKASRLLIASLAVLAIFSIQVQADEEPPMYEVHDYASGELQKRRTIGEGDPCDAEFGANLEDIVTDMERKRNGNAEVANQLRNQFKEIMEKSKDKNLCKKLSWCDMGICRKRAKIQGRSMEDGSAAPADNSSVKAEAPPPPKPVEEARPVERAAAEQTTAAPGAATVASAAAREARIFLSAACRWVVLTVIAVIIPQNL